MGKVKVSIANNQTQVKIPVGIRLLVRRCCHAVTQYEGFNDDFEVSVSFVDDETIHQLNLEHRNIDRSTDVLSFPLGENGKYSKLRNYYVFRNRFYFNRKNYGWTAAAVRSFLQTAKHVFGLCKEGEAGREKLKALRPAWRDYRHGKMGAVSDPTLRELTGV